MACPWLCQADLLQEKTLRCHDTELVSKASVFSEKREKVGRREVAGGLDAFSTEL